MFRGFRRIAALAAFGSVLALLWPMQVAAEAATINVFLMIQDGYYVEETDGTCRVDVDGQKKVLLKAIGQDGDRNGFTWFAKGDVVEGTLSNGTAGSWCAYARTLNLNSTERVDLYLHNVYLTTVTPSRIGADEYLYLEVGERGLIEQSVVTSQWAEEWGIALPTTTYGGARGSANASETRSQRESDTDTASDSETRQSSSTTTSSQSTSSRSSRSSGVVAGDWELEGDSALDILYVSIDVDSGYGRELVESMDPVDLAVEIGFLFIGEGDAPEGCRIFAYQGPLGMPAFVGLCADGDFTLALISTDRELFDDTIDDFVNGRPFSIPSGYYESY